MKTFKNDRIKIHLFVGCPNNNLPPHEHRPYPCILWINMKLLIFPSKSTADMHNLICQYNEDTLFYILDHHYTLPFFRGVCQCHGTSSARNNIIGFICFQFVKICSSKNLFKSGLGIFPKAILRFGYLLLLLF